MSIELNQDEITELALYATYELFDILEEGSSPNTVICRISCLANEVTRIEETAAGRVKKLIGLLNKLCVETNDPNFKRLLEQDIDEYTEAFRDFLDYPNEQNKEA